MGGHHTWTVRKQSRYLILSYICGDDIGNVYCQLSDSEKKQITREVVAIQRKVQRIDIDWIGLGDMLTFAAMTKVALLNMDLDTKYVDYLLDEIHPNAMEYKAFIFYCLIFCVDFMGERGMRFHDKTVPVNESIIKRLNDIFAMEHKLFTDFLV